MADTLNSEYKLRYPSMVTGKHLAASGSGMHMNVCRNGEQSPPVKHERCSSQWVKHGGKAIHHDGESRSASIFSATEKFKRLGNYITCSQPNNVYSIRLKGRKRLVIRSKKRSQQS